MSIVLVCGSRNWRDRGAIRYALSRLPEPDEAGWTVHHGDCRGADRLAAEVAEQEFGLRTVAWPADWDRHGKAAGPIRNRQMLDARPELVIAFGGGRGTRDTIHEAQRRGIKWWTVGEMAAKTEEES